MASNSHVSSCRAVPEARSLSCAMHSSARGADTILCRIAWHTGWDLVSLVVALFAAADRVRFSSTFFSNYPT